MMKTLTKIPKSKLFQYCVRIGILAFLTYETALHQIDTSAAPNVHSFCPFGGLETLFKLVASGEYLQKLFPSAVILLIGTVLLTLLMNRAFCGWICPLGTLQMLADKIARFFNVKRVRVPVKLDRYLSYFKYVVLVFVLFFTWRTGELVYQYFYPWAAYGHLAAGWSELFSKFLIGFLFLVIAVVGSIWIPHNFCRYFCPMGAFLSILAKISPTKLHLQQDTCLRCQKCSRGCPVQIDICANPQVMSHQCISCGDCVATCPQSECREYRFAGRYRIAWAVYGAIALLLFFAPVGLAKQMNAWKPMERIEDLLRDETGVLNPAYIKGSMSFEEVAGAFNIPLEAFIEYFNLPGDFDRCASFKVIATTYNIKIRDLRDFVIFYVQQHTVQ